MRGSHGRLLKPTCPSHEAVAPLGTLVRHGVMRASSAADRVRESEIVSTDNAGSAGKIPLQFLRCRYTLSTWDSAYL